MNTNYAELINNIVDIEAESTKRENLPELANSKLLLDSGKMAPLRKDVSGRVYDTIYGSNAETNTETSQIKLSKPRGMHDPLSLNYEQPPKNAKAANKLLKKERDALIDLSSVLKTPRLVKRLVNIYRILRIALPENKFTTFIESEFETVIVLLVISVGFHRLGGILFNSIQKFNDKDYVNKGLETTLDVLKCDSSIVNAQERFENEKEELIIVLKALPDRLKKNNYSIIKKYLPEIQRFSYQSS